MEEEEGALAFCSELSSRAFLAALRDALMSACGVPLVGFALEFAAAAEGADLLKLFGRARLMGICVPLSSP